MRHGKAGLCPNFSHYDNAYSGTYRLGRALRERGIPGQDLNLVSEATAPGFSTHFGARAGLGSCEAKCKQVGSQIGDFEVC